MIHIYFLYGSVALFLLGCIGMLAYEVGAVVSNKYPTITTIITPVIRANFYPSAIIFACVAGLIVFLLLDFFVRRVHHS